MTLDELRTTLQDAGWAGVDKLLLTAVRVHGDPPRIPDWGFVHCDGCGELLADIAVLPEDPSSCWTQVRSNAATPSGATFARFYCDQCLEEATSGGDNRPSSDNISF